MKKEVTIMDKRIQDIINKYKFDIGIKTYSKKHYFIQANKK